MAGTTILWARRRYCIVLRFRFGTVAKTFADSLNQPTKPVRNRLLDLVPGLSHLLRENLGRTRTKEYLVIRFRFWCPLAISAACAGIAILLLVLSADVRAGQSISVRFKQIAGAQGLSQSYVNGIVQDDDGFMWFATQDGLNRYDGFNFTVFEHDPNDALSISDQSVWAIAADRSGALWFGTEFGGLSRYNKADETFTNFTHDPDRPDSIGDGSVRVVYEDGSGVLWVGTDGSGLDRFDPSTESFVHFIHDPLDPESIAGNRIWSILETQAGALLVATDAGLSELRRETNTFSHFRHDPSDPTTISQDDIRALFEDAEGAIWVGTESRGLSRFDYRSRTFEHYVHDPADSSTISSDHISAIFQDDAGVLWIGTLDGLNTWDPESGGFTRYKYNASDRYSLSNDSIAEIYQDRSGLLWVGTESGLNYWNPTSRTMLHFRNDENDPESLSENNVMSFAENSDGDIWVGTFAGGLNLLDRETDRFRRFWHQPDNDNSLSSDQIMALLVDQAGILWAGTFDSGLNRYDSGTNTFTRYRHDPDDASSIGADGVTYLFEDSRGTLWVGTFGGGLSMFDRESQTFESFRHNEADAESLSDDRVMSIFEDSNRVLWVGTFGGGLNRFDRSSRTFVTFRADPVRIDGLSGNEIFMIQEDESRDLWIGTRARGLNRWRYEDRKIGLERFQRFDRDDGLPSQTVYGGVWGETGQLWLATGNGLSMLDIESLVFRNYDTSHGLQDDEFNLSAVHAAKDGELFFGGINGFNAFYPATLNGNRLPPPIAITKINRPNNVPAHDDREIIDSRVQLDHDENVIGFEYAALDYVAPGKNRFKYMLEGLDDDWIDAGTKRQVTYMNLPAGDYTFRVIGSNSDGVWNESGAAFGITVRPAIWKTWWAYSLYALLFIAVVLLLMKANARRVKQAGKISYAEEIALIHERMHDAQRIARIGNWELDAKTRELWWSDEIYRLFGQDPNEVGATYDLFLQLVHIEDREAVNEAVMNALAGPEPYAIDHRIILPDGTVRTMHSRAEVTLDDDGDAVRMAGTVHDITERKRAELEIAHKAEYQAMLAEVSSSLTAARSNDIDDKVAYCLKLIGTTCGLDVVSIWWVVDEKSYVIASHNWEPNGRSGKHDQVLRSDIPWIYEQLAGCKAVVVDDVDDMPEDAVTDQEILRRRGRKSIVLIPLLSDKLLEGSCAFATTRRKRAWSDETIAELKLVAETLGVALARLRVMTENERLKEKLQEENLYLRDKITLAHGFDEIIGDDPGLKRCLMAVEKVAPTTVPVLVLGETGTGKELIARAVHKLSPRRDRPMISVNCPALPSELIESELFGHEPGAFTGAQSKRRGRFELADTGTIFLDEIGELPLELQSKLLRVLQTGEYQRLGGMKTLHSDVRVIAATNRDLKQSIAKGEFRSDLYYRISSFPIELPALRNRKNDIAPLAEYFVQKHAARLGREVDAISARMLRALTAHDWPGNIRELESTIERALVSMTSGAVLELPESLPWVKDLGDAVQTTTTEYTGGLLAVDRAYIMNVLKQTGWKISGTGGAAEILGMPPSTLRSKMQRLGIRR